MIYIGIDNGTSGSIGVLDSEGHSYFHPMFKFKTLNYQKSKEKYTHRIDWAMLKKFLSYLTNEGINSTGGLIRGRIEEIRVMIEAPIANPKLWVASMSAGRAYEAVLIILEQVRLSQQTITVHQWRKKLLPGYLVREWTSAHSRKVALELAKKEFPHLSEVFEKHGDPDGLLIAKYNALSIG